MVGKLTTRQQYTLSAKKANSILGHIRQSTAVKLSEMMLHLYSALTGTDLECRVWFWALQNEYYRLTGGGIVQGYKDD